MYAVGDNAEDILNVLPLTDAQKKVVHRGGGSLHRTLRQQTKCHIWKSMFQQTESRAGWECGLFYNCSAHISRTLWIWRFERTGDKWPVRKILSKFDLESLDKINTKHLFLARKRQVRTTYQEAGSELSDSQRYTIAIYIIYVYWPHNVMGKGHSMLWEKNITSHSHSMLWETSSDSQNLLHSVMRTKRQEEASPHHRNSYSCSFSHSITI